MANKGSSGLCPVGVDTVVDTPIGGLEGHSVSHFVEEHRHIITSWIHAVPNYHRVFNFVKENISQRRNMK